MITFVLMLAAIGADPPFEPLQTPARAMVDIRQDLEHVPIESRPFMLYVWASGNDIEKWPQLNSFAVNTAMSSSLVIQHPVVVAGGSLLRWDLRQLAPDPIELVRLGKLLDDCAPANKYFFVTKNAVVGTKVSAVTAFAPHLPKTETEEVAAMMLTRKMMVVRADWFNVLLTSTTRGGRYYDFANIEKNPTGKTAQEAFLDSLGASETDSFLKGGDIRAAMSRSGVTGKPRRVDFFRGRAGRAGTGLISITHDLNDENVDPKSNPIKAVFRVQDNAREAIAEKPNGLHKFALFNNQGALTDEVPPNVAADRTIPAPHTTRLEPARGCIVCHGTSDGWKPVRDDIAGLLKSGTGANIFGDIAANFKITREQFLDQIAAWHLSEFERDRNLQRGRDDYAAAVFRATQMEPREVAQLLDDSYHRYLYDEVTADVACLELGARPKGLNSLQLLNMLLPPLPPDVSGISPEDPTISQLKDGQIVNRREWELAYPDAQVRANVVLKEYFDAQKKSKPAGSDGAGLFDVWNRGGLQAMREDNVLRDLLL